MAPASKSRRQQPAPSSSSSPASNITKDGHVLRKGNCSEKACGLEAGCVQQGDSYMCVCPHEGRPTVDLHCPRKTVTDQPKPFVVIPPTEQNKTTSNSSTQATDGVLAGIFGMFISDTKLIIILLLIILACCIFMYLSCRRKMQRSLEEKSKGITLVTPVTLTKGIINADRFANNPGYLGGDPCHLSLPLISRDNVRFNNIIGEGCFGKVFKGELVKDDDTIEIVAIKVLKNSASKEAEEDFMREVEIMSSFQHKNILSLLGVALKEQNKSPWMVFEFMPFGDLTEVLRSNSKHFRRPDSNVPLLSKESLLSIATQIASGMKYLAGQHFVHRDLACRNCLVGDNLTVKIADFGMSRDVYTCDYYKIGGSRLLPVRWMSPESVTYGRFTLESDIWSFGVVLWEIYSLGKQPYFGHSNEEVVKLILQGIMLIPPEDCPPFICELMRSCWKTEPRDRINFIELHEKLLNENNNNRTPSEFTIASDCLEVDGYLSPNPRPPHDYLQPLPD
ncbi:unnamed protein product [Nezara viridula]|uniref:Tyrosine-protein kinase catalytic domain-containing protein n=1 Tax=Nezara viridula TaxID=85310 RepID=A0A9P0DZG7_NEZVI|nr:unnamed protein product [Nezara viridula]